MALPASRQTWRIETAKSLQGSARRLVLARPVKALGPGGHQRTARGPTVGAEDHASR